MSSIAALLPIVLLFSGPDPCADAPRYRRYSAAAKGFGLGGAGLLATGGGLAGLSATPKSDAGRKAMFGIGSVAAAGGMGMIATSFGHLGARGSYCSAYLGEGEGRGRSARAIAFATVYLTISAAATGVALASIYHLLHGGKGDEPPRRETLATVGAPLGFVVSFLFGAVGGWALGTSVVDGSNVQARSYMLSFSGRF
jgi:hypothetical protein